MGPILAYRPPALAGRAWAEHATARALWRAPRTLGAALAICWLSRSAWRRAEDALFKTRSRERSGLPQKSYPHSRRIAKPNSCPYSHMLPCSHAPMLPCFPLECPLGRRLHRGPRGSPIAPLVCAVPVVRSIISLSHTDEAGIPQHNRECFLAGPSLCAARVVDVRRGTHVIVPCTSLCHLTSKSFTGPALGFGVGESAASGGCSSAEDSPSLLAACAVLGLNTVHGTQPCLSPIAAGRRGRASARLARSVRAGFVVVRSHCTGGVNPTNAFRMHTHTHY